MIDRKTEHEKRITQRFGVLAATIANFSMCEKHDFQAWDFFDLPEPEPVELTQEQMLQWAKGFAAHFNGRKDSN